MQLKTILSSLFLAACTLTALGGATAHGDSEASSSNYRSWYPALIKIQDREAIVHLEAAGVNILRQRDNLLLCFIPLANESEEANKSRKKELPSLRRINRIKGVDRIERGRDLSLSMDKAREWYNAEDIHTGANLPAPYTGRGVVTGICDIGIDPLHIAFRDENGESRIKRLVYYREGEGQRIVMESEEEFKKAGTDSDENWHASHVAGIMAGSYGKYRGMAPDSEIVITTSQLSDVGLLCGAEDILDYAKENGKRAVINMSMANFTGPHDGSSLFSQYLDLIGEEAIVVLSAGNGGNTNYTLPVTFSPGMEKVELALYSSDWQQFHPYGAVDMWSRNDTPFSVRFGIFDADEKVMVKYFPKQSLSEGCRFSVTSDPSQAQENEKEKTVFDATFAAIFKGWISLSGGIYKENGRYNITMEYDAATESVSAKGNWARYVPVVEVSGDPDTDVDIYADYSYTWFRQMPGSPAPGPILSFSDLASGYKIISVGMFVNNNTFPTLSGEPVTRDMEPGTVSPHSSFSTLADGRVMPLTVAPGSGVMAPISSYYTLKHPDSKDGIYAESVVDGRKHGWAMNSGTSMSSPYVAGTIACWLEANPHLSTQDVMDIISSTNRLDYPDPDNPRHGCGWFDPMEGIKRALAMTTGIDTIDQERVDSPRLSISGNLLSLWNPGGSLRRVCISDLRGSTLLSFESSNTSESFTLSELSSGVYIAYIEGFTSPLKFLIQ